METNNCPSGLITVETFCHLRKMVWDEQERVVFAAQRMQRDSLFEFVTEF